MTNPVLAERVERRIKRLAKRGLHLLSPRRGEPQPVYVLGYGRSGTTMIIDVLEHDLRIDVYQENDTRVASEFMLVPEKLYREIQANRAPVALMKPILNSFQVKWLLNSHPNAKVVWMLRGVDAVVSSALKKFGTQVAEYLQNAVFGVEDGSWIVRTIPTETLEAVRAMRVEEFSAADWMAMVWWSVNSTMLDSKVRDSHRTLIVQYEELLKFPDKTMRAVYQHIGLTYRKDSTRWIGAGSPTPPQTVQLGPVVRQRCEDLICRLAASPQ